jgi:hypothetical protein
VTDDPEERTDGPPDPELDPEQSPGFGDAPVAIEDIDVGRDVTLGEASPEELTASDISRIADDEIVSLIETLRSGPPTERQRAALALAERTPSDPILEALSEAATDDPDDDVRQFAVEALGKLGGDLAAETALAVLGDAEAWVRAEALVALDRLDRDGHAPAIEGCLTDDHHAVRRNAAISLFKRRGEDAIDDLLPLVDDPSDRVREWVAHMLGGIRAEPAQDALQQLRTDESQIVRATAENALEVDPDRFRRRFTSTLDDSTEPLPGEDLLNRQPNL